MMEETMQDPHATETIDDDDEPTLRYTLSSLPDDDLDDLARSVGCSLEGILVRREIDRRAARKCT